MKYSYMLILLTYFKNALEEYKVIFTPRIEHPIISQKMVLRVSGLSFISEILKEI